MSTYSLNWLELGTLNFTLVNEISLEKNGAKE